MPLVLLTGYNVVKSIQFGTYRTLGNPITVCRVYESRGVDELLLLDIRATTEKRGPGLDIIRDIAGECFMSLTVGGGISTLEQAREILRNGADKVAINSAAISNPGLIAEISQEFGAQCVVVSIDVKQHADGSYEVYSHGGKQPTGLDPLAWACEVDGRGAGEILLNSIDRDGMMQGYDLALLKSVSEAISTPLIAAGGAGEPRHFTEAFIEAKVDAVAAGSIYHFTSHTPRSVKTELASHGIPVRA